MRSGVPYSVTIPFEYGTPTGVVTYSLSDEDGEILNGTVDPPDGALSTTISVSGSNNTIPSGTHFGFRSLTWSYSVGANTYFGEARWTLEFSIPFGVTFDGVRRKLGIDDAGALPDADIPLVASYVRLGAQIGSTTLDGYATGTSIQRLTIIDALEAGAALELLPSMAVRVAKSETSGTNAFTRQNIDWENLRGNLESYVAAATTMAVPSSEAVGGNLFVLSTPALDLFPDG